MAIGRPPPPRSAPRAVAGRSAVVAASLAVTAGTVVRFHAFPLFRLLLLPLLFDSFVCLVFVLVVIVIVVVVVLVLARQQRSHAPNSPVRRSILRHLLFRRRRSLLRRPRRRLLTSASTGSLQ